MALFDNVIDRASLPAGIAIVTVVCVAYMLMRCMQRKPADTKGTFEEIPLTDLGETAALEVSYRLRLATMILSLSLSDLCCAADIVISWPRLEQRQRSYKTSCYNRGHNNMITEI